MLLEDRGFIFIAGVIAPCETLIHIHRVGHPDAGLLRTPWGASPFLATGTGDHESCLRAFLNQPPFELRQRWRGSEAGTAQAGKPRLLVPGAGEVVCERDPLSEGRSAPSGPLWRLRSGPRKACSPQLRRHLPQGSVKVWGQLEDALAPRGSQRRYRLHVSAA